MRGALTAVLALWATMAPAQDCRLALVLALDVSSSVDAREDGLQRGGLAAALVAPEVERAFFAAPAPVALAVFEWSGRFNQKLLLDWRLVDRPEVLRTAAGVIAASRRGSADYPTAMGHALAFAARLLARAPDCAMQTVDVAGDGENNEGYGPQIAYAHFAFDGVTVNGLVVNAADFEGELTLLDFFRDQVLRGPGAFLEVAQGFDDYADAMRRKLEREVMPRVVGSLDGVARPG
ncbi:MAG: DUF1194 domain-containing protein [Pseudooceanicola sp.]|nr:DUF1194 domain-containing protein [Pseudooceanicola sp.]